MKGVHFNELHSFEDFRLILSSKTIEAPNPKTIEISVDGSDGKIDLTDYFGETKYENRTLEFNFSSIVPMNEFLEQFSKINNAIHGKKMKIIMDDDPEFYYIGRCSVSAWKWNGRVIELTVKCDCEPYKYKCNKTSRTDVISENATISYTNLRKKVVPTFTVDGTIKVSFGTTTYALDAGKYILPNVEFVAGVNKVTYIGSATVTVEYQEGGL